MSKHTKGPWGIMKGDHGPMIFSGECGRGVAMLAKQVTTSECDANASLIAAAPDLLSCLKDLLESLEAENPLSYQSGIAAAKLAIAKAKGEK